MSRMLNGKVADEKQLCYPKQNNKDSGLNNLRNLTQNFCFSLYALCSQGTHSHSTQRSESIQAGTKRHVKFRKLFDPES